MTILRLDKVTVRFCGLTAVEGLDCTVDERQIFSIIGPNGAGKTTVFNVITGIYEPTTGSVGFRDQALRRPFTWRVAALCALVGLATGLVAAVAMLDVNALWKAAIKRNYAGAGETFSYGTAWRSAQDYVAGNLALDRLRGNRWAVQTADGRRTLGFAKDLDEAETLRARFAKLIAVASRAQRDAADGALVERDGHWIVLDSDGQTELASFDSRADGEAVLTKYAAIAAEPARRRRAALLALVCGIAVGAAGSWTMWNRARRTPDVISCAGIARTFQNIRLFQNMSVLDNVLTGMSRQLRGGVIAMALQLPRLRERERAARERARELVRFVGLEGKESQWAKNLPYGDQRRLEIARALATEPRLILLDEPAAGMNPAESIELNGLISEIRARGVSVLLIEHHMQVVMGISDRIAVLDYGVKIAEGTPGEVAANPRVIAAYLGSEEVS